MLLAAFLIRGFAFFKYAYPTGADYGHHTYFADLYLEEGRLPTRFPHYQLGETRSSVLPGCSLIYAVLAAVSARSAVELAAMTSLFTLIEVAGVYFLAFRIFGQFEAAFVAALVCAFSPSSATMAAWSGYANLISLAFMPYAFVAWLDYWESPSRFFGLVVIIVCGVASIHHLSTLWLGLTLVLFSIVHIAVTPVKSVRKLVLLVLAGGAIGAPIVLRILDLYEVYATSTPEKDRFVSVPLGWSDWSATISIAALPFLVAGTARLLSMSHLRWPHRVLITSYIAVSVIAAFGWIFGLEFHYIRSLYFLPLPIAMGAAAFVTLWQRTLTRAVVVTSLAASLGVGTLFLANRTADYYEIVSPGVIQATDWLREFSKPDDVMVSGGFLGFHLPRLLERPLMVAIPPELPTNPDDVEAAADAWSILMGHEGIEQALERNHVKYVIVRARGQDLPDPHRSMSVAEAHPRLWLVYRNEDVMIYRVRALDEVLVQRQ